MDANFVFISNLTRKINRDLTWKSSLSLWSGGQTFSDNFFFHKKDARNNISHHFYIFRHPMAARKTKHLKTIWLKCTKIPKVLFTGEQILLAVKWSHKTLKSEREKLLLSIFGLTFCGLCSIAEESMSRLRNPLRETRF